MRVFGDDEPHPEAAPRELERAVSELGLRGALLCGRTRDRHLDHPALRLMLAKAAELGVPLFIHPQTPPPAVNPNRERKSSGSETTFDRDLIDPAEIEAGVLRMADDVWTWCQRRQAFGRTVTVKIKFQDFRQITRSRSHRGAVDTQHLLRSASLDLVRSIYPPEKGIRLVGVTVSNFAAPQAVSPTKLPIFAEGAA